jgi:type I restriction enzyme, S subunit
VKNGWLECHLGDVVTLKRGYDLPNRERTPGNVPIISSSGVTDFHNAAKVKGPGVVTGRYGTLGEVFYVEEDFWPLNTSLYVQNFKGNDPRWIAYFLGSLDLGSQNTAGAVPGLNRNALHLLQVKLPLLETQKKIAAILSSYDDLIENNTRRIEILEDMARGLYREWFVNFRFPGHEKVEMVDSSMGLVPANWNVLPASKIIEIDPKTVVARDGEKAFIPMGSLSTTSMIIESIESRGGNSGSKFQNGDTLFARITPCLENGKTGFVNFLPTNADKAFGSTEFVVMRSKTVCPEYVYLLARSEPFREHAMKSMSGATGRQRVSTKCFDMFFIAQPDQDTLTRFKAIMEPIFTHVFSLARKNANLRRTRDLLLPKLISGEIDVSTLEIAGVTGPETAIESV